MANFVSNANAVELMKAIAAKFNALGGAYRFRGSVAFASLPATITPDMAGNVYNVTDNFTTDSRFIEGAGKEYNAGTNVVVTDLSTVAYNAVTPVGTENPSSEGWYEEVSTGVYERTADIAVASGKTYYEKVVTANVKFDVIASFIDFSDVYDMIADTFETTEAYSTGDVVIYDGGLYQFNTDHAAGAWDSTQVDSVTLEELVNAAEPDELTTAQVNALKALLA